MACSSGSETCSSSQVNPEMVPEFENAGLQFVGKDESGRRMEVRLKPLLKNLLFWQKLCLNKVANFPDNRNTKSPIFCWRTISSRVQIKTFKTFSLVCW
jgi:hypothetical protein